MTRKVLIATVTNAAYLLSAWAMWRYSEDLIPVSIGAGLLAVFSALHHYRNTKFTLSLDYLGMYIVLMALIGVGVGVEDEWGAALILGLPAVLVAVLKPNRVVLAALITMVFGLMVYFHPAGALHTAAFASIAFVFNQIGDNVHKEYHSLIHGMGWHVPTAYAIFLAGVYLI